MESQSEFIRQVYNSADELPRVSWNDTTSHILKPCLGAMISNDSRGTCFLIAQDIAVTAAHNICQKNGRKRNYIVDQRIFFGINGKIQSSLQEYRIAKKKYSDSSDGSNPLIAFIPEGYFEEQITEQEIESIPEGQQKEQKKKQKMQRMQKMARYDYAFIKLSQKVKQSPCLTLAINWSSSKQTLGVYGYAKDKNLDRRNKLEGNQDQIYPYGKTETERVYRIVAQIRHKKYLEYSIPTAKGSSGSPVFLNKGKKNQIVGVHNHGKSIIKSYQNMARLIDSEFIMQLFEWKRENDCCDFQVRNLSKSQCLVFTNETELNSPQLCQFLQNQPPLQQRSKFVEFYDNKRYVSLASQRQGYTFSRELSDEKLGRLEILNLSKCVKNQEFLGHEGCRKLIQCSFPVLKFLYLSQCKVKDDGCYYLSKGNWPNLERLHLVSNFIKDQGCKALCQTQWKQMDELYLGQNFLSQQSCLYLKQAVKQSKWPKLQTLSLPRNTIRSKGYQLLSKTEWPKLKTLDVVNNNIKKEEVRESTKRFMDKKINAIIEIHQTLSQIYWEKVLENPCWLSVFLLIWLIMIMI